MVSSIIVAAGSGKRMGKSINKVFLDLGGYPVLFHSIKAFQDHPQVDEIILVLKEEEMDGYSKEFASFMFDKVKRVTPGGAERMDSVNRGLQCLDPQSEIVLIHDGARPFVSQEIISKGIEGARLWGAACPGVEPKDTIKGVDREGMIQKELKRDQLRALQTPQAFQSEWLRELMDEARKAGLQYTDDTSLFYAAGQKVWVYPGSYRNFKITTEEDLQLGRILIRDTEGVNNQG